MVQLATGMRRKITSVVRKFCFKMNGLQTNSNSDVIPLGSYNILIGMNWREAQQDILDFHDKSMICLDKDSKDV